MKFMPNWPFWALLAFGYLNNGWQGFFGMLKMMVMFIIISLLVLAVATFFASDFRRLLIEEKYLPLESRFFKFFCRFGMHTWDKVVEDKPKTADGAFMQDVYRMKYGERKALCCDRQQVVCSTIEGKHWGKLDEKYYCLREDCRQ